METRKFKGEVPGATSGLLNKQVLPRFSASEVRYQNAGKSLHLGTSTSYYLGIYYCVVVFKIKRMD